MLIDLLVGLSIGALVLGAAIAAMLVAREAASTVSETSLLQQQTSYALRALGQQIRPAGSLEVQASASAPGRVQFAAVVPGADPGMPVVQGKDGAKGASDSLRVMRAAASLIGSQQEDCLGQKVPPGQRIEAGFEVDTKESLRCRSGGQVQPLVSGVTAFRLRYRVLQDGQVRDLRASEVDAAGLWPAVIAVEACLDLHGEERSSAHDTRYTDCAGQRVGNDGRLHLVTRKLFALRTRTGD